MGGAHEAQPISPLYLPVSPYISLYLEVGGAYEAQHGQAWQRAARQGGDQGLGVADLAVLLQVEHLQVGQRA